MTERPWTITITGVGPCCNTLRGQDTPEDADRIMRQLVQELNAAGHIITASFTTEPSKGTDAQQSTHIPGKILAMGTTP